MHEGGRDADDDRQAQYHQAAGNDRDDDCPPEDRLLFHRVFRTHGLCNQSGRAGTQEIEYRQQEIEDQRANRQTADQLGLSHLADNAHIDKSEKRRGDRSKRHGNGDQHHHPVCYFERPCYATTLQRLVHDACPEYSPQIKTIYSGINRNYR